MGSRRGRRPASERRGESTTPTPQSPSRAERRKAAALQRPARQHERDISIFPPIEPDSRLERVAALPWVLPLVIIIGIALRAAHVMWLRDSPFFSSLMLDARAYDEWAQQIAAGDWIGRTAFWVDPLYAYMLAGLYSLAGHELLLPRLVNAGFGIATALIVARTARLVWASRLAEVVAALLVVAFIPAIHFEGQIEKTALTVVLLAGAIHLFLVGTPRAIAAAGVVAGLATLARGNALLFLVPAALVLAFGWDRPRHDAFAATPAQRRWRAALLLAGALPVIALATVHNYLASGERVLTTTNLGINLYLGNHAGNEHGYYDPPDFLHPSTQTEIPDFRSEAQRRTGIELSDSALSSYWAAQARQAVWDNPALAISRTFHKLQLVLHNDEIPDSESVELVGLWSPIVRSPGLWFGQLLVLAMLGTVVGWRRRGVRVLAGIVAIYIASLLPFFIMARLRVQLLPPLAVLGSGAVVWLVAVGRAGYRRPLAYAAAILAVGALLTYPRPAWMAQRRTSGLAIGWHNLGATLAESNRTEEAIRAYERAVAVDAKAVPAALRKLGSYYEERQEYVRAESAMRRAVELRPNSVSGRDALRKLYDTMLADPRWRDDKQVRSRRQGLGEPGSTAAQNPVADAMAQARAHLAGKRYAEAITTLQDAVRTGPYDENLHYMLGQAMERYASADDMVAFFSAEVDRDKKPQTSHYFWAVGLARQGEIDGAIARLQKAIEIDPAHEMSQHQWGLLLERQGRLDDALEHLTEATRIHPEFVGALRDAARVADLLGRGAEAETFRSRAASADPNSPRRFVYWARYLHEHGRSAAALPEIERMLAQRPNDEEALKLRAQIRATLGDGASAAAPASAPIPATPAATPAMLATISPTSGPAWALSSEARAALVASLSARRAGMPVWIVYDSRYASAEAFARQLVAIFEEAHWSAKPLARASFAMRPGLFIFAADDPPSDSSSAAGESLIAANLKPTIGTGYRAYAEEQRANNPNWRGISFEPEQSFVIAVGRPPEP